MTLPIDGGRVDEASNGVLKQPGEFKLHFQAGASPRSFNWGMNSDWGTDSGDSKPPTPKFGFLLGFRPRYFGNNE